MSKVLWHITMSFDGFVAKPGDDMTWLFAGGFAPDSQFVDGLLDQIGAVLIGHRTYHGGDTEQGAKTEKGRAYGGHGRVRSSCSPETLPTPQLLASPS